MRMAITMETDEVWLNKVYDMIALSKHRNIIEDDSRFLECNIFDEDIKRMLDYGLIKKDPIEDKFILTERIYQYTEPDIIRDNWLHLDNMTRRRFIDQLDVPDILDILKFCAVFSPVRSKQRYFDKIKHHVEAYQNNSDIYQLHSTQHLITYLNLPTHRRTLSMKIIHYHKSKKNHRYYIANSYLEKDTIDYLEKRDNFKPAISVVGQSCPLGLNKVECESYWRQENGFDRYAYKDVHASGGKIRFYLSRMYMGVYFRVLDAYYKNTKRHKDYTFIQSIRIFYDDLLKMLQEDDVLPLIKESPKYRGWENIAMTSRASLEPLSDNGFIPIYKRTGHKKSKKKMLITLERFKQMSIPDQYKKLSREDAQKIANILDIRFI